MKAREGKGNVINEMKLILPSYSVNEGGSKGNHCGVLLAARSDGS